jgi:hypothetical protein
MTRPETGPMQFGDDHTGVFIRGDHAMAMAMMLREHVEDMMRRGGIDPILGHSLLDLTNDLAGCDERGQRHGLQRMRPFDECVTEDP